MGAGRCLWERTQAIQTLNLTIKSGYLSTIWTDNLITGVPTYQVNSVPTGAGVQFTAEATWSDGVTRPMWNYPFQGAFNAASLGTWWSTNPKVMTINQYGHAVAYNIRYSADLVQVGQRRYVLTLDNDCYPVVHGGRSTRAGLLVSQIALLPRRRNVRPSR